MAGIYLDANIIFDIVRKRRASKAYSLLTGYKPYISPLTIHILNYVYGQVMPQKALAKHLSDYILVPLDQSICQQALLGPTSDFEDNVQLYSATKAECHKFYTRDKKLIWLGHFNDFEILSPYPEDNQSPHV
jgi:predicted nucleic acid-binding protein